MMKFIPLLKVGVIFVFVEYVSHSMWCTEENRKMHRTVDRVEVILSGYVRIEKLLCTEENLDWSDTHPDMMLAENWFDWAVHCFAPTRAFIKLLSFFFLLTYGVAPKPCMHILNPILKKKITSVVWWTFLLWYCYD